jgi:uridine phosphorylase
MPSRLRPTASVAADAILVGDPGRALMLAQELLEQPKMCNHARGLWGYSGRTPAGDELTLQSTGMGGPSAALVLDDLAELGVVRAVRVGTCTGLDPGLSPGDRLLVTEARAWGGPGHERGELVHPAPELLARLRAELTTAAQPARVASLDTLHGETSATAVEGDAADMQTATLLARGRALGIAVAAILVVVESARGEQLDDEALELAATGAGRAAAAVLSA